MPAFTECLGLEKAVRMARSITDKVRGIHHYAKTYFDYNWTRTNGDMATRLVERIKQAFPQARSEKNPEHQGHSGPGNAASRVVETKPEKNYEAIEEGRTRRAGLL